MKNQEQRKASVDIHEYSKHPGTGEYFYDDDNEPMIGHFFQFKDENDKPISDLDGPYHSDEEVKAAALSEARKMGLYLVS